MIQTPLAAPRSTGSIPWECAVASLLGACLACSSTAGPPEVASVEITPHSWTFTAVGDTVLFSAEAKDASGRTIPDLAFTWGRESGGVVEIRAAGLVIAVGTGSTRVTATTDGVTGRASVSVTQTVASVVIVSSDLRVTALGDSIELRAMAFDARSNPVTGVTVFSFTSLNEAVATVGTGGWVKAVSPGVVDIAASAASKADTARIEVRQDVANVMIMPDSAILEVGASRQFTAVMEDRNGYAVTDRSPDWASTDTLVVVVTATGLAAAGGGKLGPSAVVASSGAASAAVPVYVFTTFAAVSAGPEHTCALASSGRPYCWGMLSLATGATSPVPLAPAGAPELKSIGAGVSVACGLGTVGAAYCWGDAPFPAAPVAASDVVTFSWLSVGFREVCGVTPSGEAYCWGWQYTPDGGVMTPSPALVPGGLSFTTISANAGYVCATTGGGLAYCWGFNAVGSLGDSTYDDRSEPTPVWGNHTYLLVAAGGGHTCAIGTDHSTWCWGRNLYGAFGDGSTTSSTVPVPAASGLELSSVTPADFHTCGLDASGIAYCWGLAERGQLGHGIQEQMHLEPVPVSGGLTFVSISAGGQHSCALTAAGRVYCWGSNGTHEVGDGTAVDRFVPTLIAGSRP